MPPNNALVTDVCGRRLPRLLQRGTTRTLGGMYMRRALFGIAAIPLGLATWVLVLLLLRQLYDWGLPFGGALFWLSHWTFVGWLFAIALMVLWYKFLVRRFVPRRAGREDSQSERHAT